MNENALNRAAAIALAFGVAACTGLGGGSSSTGGSSGGSSGSTGGSSGAAGFTITVDPTLGTPYEINLGDPTNNIGTPDAGSTWYQSVQPDSTTLSFTGGGPSTLTGAYQLAIAGNTATWTLNSSGTNVGANPPDGLAAISGLVGATVCYRSPGAHTVNFQMSAVSTPTCGGCGQDEMLVGTVDESQTFLRQVLTCTFGQTSTPQTSTLSGTYSAAADATGSGCLPIPLAIRASAEPSALCQNNPAPTAAAATIASTIAITATGM